MKLSIERNIMGDTERERPSVNSLVKKVVQTLREMGFEEGELIGFLGETDQQEGILLYPFLHRGKRVCTSITPEGEEELAVIKRTGEVRVFNKVIIPKGDVSRLVRARSLPARMRTDDFHLEQDRKIFPFSEKSRQRFLVFVSKGKGPFFLEIFLEIGLAFSPISLRSDKWPEELNFFFVCEGEDPETRERKRWTWAVGEKINKEVRVYCDGKFKFELSSIPKEALSLLVKGIDNWLNKAQGERSRPKQEIGRYY